MAKLAGDVKNQMDGMQSQMDGMQSHILQAFEKLSAQIAGSPPPAQSPVRRATDTAYYPNNPSDQSPPGDTNVWSTTPNNSITTNRNKPPSSTQTQAPAVYIIQTPQNNLMARY